MASAVMTPTELMQQLGIGKSRFYVIKERFRHLENVAVSQVLGHTVYNRTKVEQFLADRIVLVKRRA